LELTKNEEEESPPHSELKLSEIDKQEAASAIILQHTVNDQIQASETNTLDLETLLLKESLATLPDHNAREGIHPETQSQIILNKQDKDQ